jgi:17beta-estradiol 17-dehydrogenase / very-long-chain 3-oxoacyl-CoA reductase
MSLRWIFGFLGFAVVARWLIDRLIWLYNLKFGGQRDLTATYGKGSYVLVTGGSEGIGLAMAKQFARKGFNLFLVARSQDKLEAAKAAVLKQYPSCKVLTRSFDFDQITEPANFDLSKAFGFDLTTIDVSVLFNNVGIGFPLPFYDNNEVDIVKLIKLNCAAQLVCSVYFAKYFQNRKHKSMILNTSSISETIPVPGFSAYGASKLFNKFLTRSQGNFDDKIDHYCYIPGFIPTALTNFKRGFFSVDADLDASYAICHVGSLKHTFSGHWRHELMAWGMSWVPVSLVPNIRIKKEKSNR